MLLRDGDDRVRLIFRLPNLRSSKYNISRHASTITVADTAMKYIPEPHVIPIAAVTHKPAAVVSPRTTCFWKMMIPVPMKPMPVTTCEAIRDGSSDMLVEPSASIAPKPECDSIIKRALPRPTRKCVRKPASFDRYSRSIPMIPPRMPAMNIRKIKSQFINISFCINLGTKIMLTSLSDKPYLPMNDERGGDFHLFSDRYHRYTADMPSLSGVEWRQPSLCSRPTSSSLRGVPSGLEVSYSIAPSKPTIALMVRASSSMEQSSPVPILICISSE